jgi:predicted PurR-regulated permease PerM
MTESKKVIDYTHSINRLMTVFIIALVIFGLYAGKTFIIPFVVALVIFFILINFENLISKSIKKLLSLIIKKQLSERLNKVISIFSLLLSLTISFFVLLSFSRIITNNFNEMLSYTQKYQMLFTEKIMQYNNMVLEAHGPDRHEKGLSPVQQIISIIPETHLPIIDGTVIARINFNSLLNRVGGLAGRGIADFMLVVVYLIFLYMERANFPEKLKRIRSERPKFEKFGKIIREIEKDLVRYFGIKTAISFATAALCFFVMNWFGLDFVWLWAFIIFVLNFIPTIGSIVATILPSVLGLIVFDSFIEAIFLAIIITTIQFMIGSVVEPKFQGDRLNLAPIMILLSLAIWGAIWGVVGMFLAVPIMVMVNASLAQFETTKPLAMLFSSTGEVGKEKTKKKEKI